ncbi:Fumarylacetoacetate (FAA) hydrolase family protein [Pseudobythopirellula maris]|uniref:Fumarylacetoacetate (FAA) hydrolase family protein n=1 Tax=Pseudobythopirellula maris TaxID=2527991 RepID=A0A5C5ZSK3_9BACT|nr:fumarylacetoacetate hydrolase family protein [Pseudobythopirellula maris]TWT90216.1 Fumarylacetoacetate (FAA) hydrolase family protein [Pseudobythopirellula maris]
MLLYNTSSGPILRDASRYARIDQPWSDLVNKPDLPELLAGQAGRLAEDPALAALAESPLAPLGERQEIWAAGVTYYRSRTARMEESKTAGGGSFYDRVYEAERPEIFFKATPHRTVGPGGSMRLRSDSKWIVPEPELVLVVAHTGKIVGYTIGNDLSCRDIEGENPLYLPQAKTFDRCAAVGPAIYVPQAGSIGNDSSVTMRIERDGAAVFEGETTLDQMKRGHEELVGFLMRDNPHPHGVLLMTGAGIIPPDGFSLASGDVVSIAIDSIGQLCNTME